MDSGLVGQVAFVTCRESVEALLVVGILYSWLNSNPLAQRGKGYLWGGVGAGFGLAAFLAYLLIAANDAFGEAGQNWFMFALLFAAAFLIVQMALWMKEHGRSMKSNLQSGLEQSAESQNWWGVFALAAIAVAREGSETVVFLSGAFLGLNSASGYLSFGVGLAVGLGLALILFWALQAGSRFISWKWFFRVTEILLLFLGGALFMASLNNAFAALAPRINPAWLDSALAWLNKTTSWYDLSAWIDDTRGFGGLMATMFGFRARPARLEIAAFLIYWAIALSLLAWQNRRLSKRRNSGGSAPHLANKSSSA